MACGATLADRSARYNTLEYRQDLARVAERGKLDEPIRYEKNNANNSAIEAITTLSPEPWTLRRIIGQMGLGSRTPPIVGAADQVVDELIS